MKCAHKYMKDIFNLLSCAGRGVDDSVGSRDCLLDNVGVAGIVSVSIGKGLALAATGWYPVGNWRGPTTCGPETHPKGRNP